MVATSAYAYVCFIILSVFIYVFLFYVQGLDAPDRKNYLNFFLDSDGSRFEPGFNLYGEVLGFFGIDPFFSVFLTGFLGLIFSFFAAKSFFKNPVFLFISLYFIFFIVFSMFSFIQIRASGAIWFSVSLFFSLHLSKFLPKLLTVALILLSTFWHFLILGFSLAVFYNFYIRKIGKLEIFALSIFCVLFGFFWESAVSWGGLNNYYKVYFYTLRNNLYTSPYMLLYFFVLMFIFLMAKSRVEFSRISCYCLPFVYLGVPPMILAYFSGFDIFVKFSAPFALITYFVFFDVFFRFFRSHLSVFSIYFLFCLLPTFVVFPYFRY